MQKQLSLKFAFFSPQGTYFIQNDLYLKFQGSTAQNGGQIIYEIQLAKALVQQGHSVDIFARNYLTPKLEIEHYENRSFRIFHIPTSAPKAIEKEQYYPWYSEYLSKTIDLINAKALKYDVLVGHYADGMTIASCVQEYLSRKNQQVVNISFTHSLGLQKARSLIESKPEAFEETSAKLNIKARLGFQLASMVYSDGIVCLSEIQKQMLVKDYYFPNDQITIIGSGVNTSIFHKMKNVDRKSMIRKLREKRKDISQKSYQLLSSGKILLGFGRFVAVKGVFNAVRAMQQIVQSHSDVVYVYIGGNIPAITNEESQLYNKCIDYAYQRRYRDNIVFLGRMDQSQISLWLNISTAYLHCASLEPFGIAPIEAAATGTVVLISKTSGASEMLKDKVHAVHIDPQSPANIAKKVKEILMDPLLRSSVIENAAKLLTKQFTWSAKASDVVEFVKLMQYKTMQKRAERIKYPNFLKQASKNCMRSQTSEFSRSNPQKDMQAKHLLFKLLRFANAPILKLSRKNENYFLDNQQSSQSVTTQNDDEHSTSENDL